MAAHLGAHETMEVHEILTCAIDGINQFQLYRPFVKDQELLQMLDHQLQFMMNEYNGMVQTINMQGQGQAVPYRSPKNLQPTYGLDHPAAQSPNLSMNQMDDRDVASGMLGSHKASATMKMIAALECANPQLRHLMQQGAVNCSEQAYEVWQYMNQKGFYQVPTMKEQTTNTVLNTYQTAGNMNASYTMAPPQTMMPPTNSFRQ
ncbi:spore coat protein [Paenibacillus solisilvae]|uniref:Spore coat protein n=1 Tax=Paenibacillus solisilvae TaxID=2486751 RepID=A0ABW0VZ55_9BACL